MISYFMILLVLPFGGFGDEAITEETTVAAIEETTTEQALNQEKDETEAITETMEPVPKSVTIETTLNLQPEITATNTTINT